MTDQEAFIRLSCALTGLTDTEIPAAVEQQDAGGNTVKLSDVYLQRLRAAYPVEFGELFAAWRSVQLDPDPATRLSEKLLATDAAGLRLRIAARQVIKIWYLSTMDDPWAALAKDGKSGAQVGGDLGQFQTGAIWKLIGAPVQGYSNFRHGYWSEKPKA
jgi:hypothetical protein